MGLSDVMPWVSVPAAEVRDIYPISLDEALAQMMYFQGNPYSLLGSQTLAASQEEMGGDYRSLARLAYMQNGVVFACMNTRALLFSEARFQFRRLRNGRPGDLFGGTELAILERPWPGGTTGDLLTRAIQDHDLDGNFYATIIGGQVKRLRPDWVSILIGSRSEADAPSWAIDAEIAGYVYHPGGRLSGYDPIALLPNEVCHFATNPDPLFRFRGMSWLTPIIREIQADKAATLHKEKFFENGATPNMVVKFDLDDVDKMRPWINIFREQHEGSMNAYRTLFVGAGTDATPVGSNFQQIEFKATQGAGETRIAAAARVPPVLAGLSEGLQAATYSNYASARRHFADGTLRPLWRNVAGSLANLITLPSGAELWYDDRDIPFLAEDQKDAAEIGQVKAAAMRTLIEAGYDPDSVTSAVTSGDLGRLVHTGLVSVQLQAPGAPQALPGAPAPTNGGNPVPTPA